MYEVPPRVLPWTRDKWQQWAFDNIMGAVIGWFLFSRPALLLTTPFTYLAANYALLILLALFIGASVGFAQRLLVHSLAISRDWWTLVTGLSACSGAVLMILGVASGRLALEALDSAGSFIIPLSCLGACIGLAQWVGLRKNFLQAWWWIIATIFGAALGSSAGCILPRHITDVFEARVLLGLIVGMGLYAAVTGACLRRLLPSERVSQ